MPKMMMGGEAADMDSLYGGGTPAGETPSEEGRESVDQEEAEQANTAVVPLKVLMGKSTEPLKKGDEVVLKIVEVYGDEAEVEYSETKPSEIGEGEGYGKSADQEIDEMDQGGANPGGMGY